VAPWDDETPPDEPIPPGGGADTAGGEAGNTEGGAAQTNTAVGSGDTAVGPVGNTAVGTALGRLAVEHPGRVRAWNVGGAFRQKYEVAISQRGADAKLSQVIYIYIERERDVYVYVYIYIYIYIVRSMRLPSRSGARMRSSRRFYI